MSSYAQALRKPNTVREITKEILVDCAGLATGDTAVGFTIPAGKFVTGAFISNPANDLTGGSSATVGVKVGTVQLIADTLVTSVKNSGVGAEDATPDYNASARTVYLVVGTAALTAGVVAVKVSYV